VGSARVTALSSIRSEVRVGCSGWQYRHWAASATTAAGAPLAGNDAPFYPAGLPQWRWFDHYARTFDTVEVNNSFYRLPPPETFAKWRDQAPPGFLYAIKASRFLTHMKKLKDPDDPLARFFDNVRELGPTLGAVLYQLPPNFGINLERLAAFLEAIPLVARRSRLSGRPHHVIEFRDPSWYDDRVYSLLDRHRVALCLHDMQGSATERVVVGGCVYARFHFGTTRYGGRYDDRRLDEWADWLAGRAREGLDVFAYFNNDTGGHAPRDAIRLRTRIHERLAHAAAS
jgi:uncharacterized protein YecE (DUF72 family)